MSDTSTSRPGSIPTESEMASIKSIFERAANSIVEASKLAVDVAELRKQVEALRSEIETVRASNKWLDEQLMDTRKARDEAREKAHQTQMELDTAKSQIEGLTSRSDSQERAIASLKDERDGLYQELDRVEKDRDEAKAQVAELQDKARQAQEHLAKVLAVFAPAKQEEPAPLASGSSSGASSEAGQGNEPAKPDHGNDAPAMQEANPVQQSGWGQGGDAQQLVEGRDAWIDVHGQRHNYGG